MPCTSLLELIEIEPSNASQQLAVLRRTSLVTSTRSGGEVVYSVSVPEVDLLLAARAILSGIIVVRDEPEPQLTGTSTESLTGAFDLMSSAVDGSRTTRWTQVARRRTRRSRPGDPTGRPRGPGRDLPAGPPRWACRVALALGFELRLRYGRDGRTRHYSGRGRRACRHLRW